MQKHLFLSIISATFSICVYSQSVDSITNKNYYSFFSIKPGGSINWLRISDAVPIIIDELLKRGIKYHTISVGDLIRMSDSIHLVVTVSFSKDDKDYGFIYETGHGIISNSKIPVDIKSRDFLSDSEQRYTQLELDSLSKKSNYTKINPLPKNIFLLKENCYWYLFDNKGTNYPVSKTTAEKILREDIRDYLSKNGID